MSLDYPNREVWLAVRSTIRKPARYIHVSGYGRAARCGMIVEVAIPAGVTYAVGRNARKRARRVAS